MKEKLNDINNDLFHIHSLAYLLVGLYQEKVDNKELDDSNNISSPLLSIAEMIMEKSKACLNRMDLVDGEMQDKGI